MKNLDLVFPNIDHRSGISGAIVLTSLGEPSEHFGRRFWEICALTGAS